MKICHFVSGDLWAGAESMVFSLLGNLARHEDVSLHAVILNNGILEQKLRRLPITVHLLDESEMSFVQITRAFRTIMKREGFDIVHSHRYKENIASALARGFSRTPALVATQHGLPEFFGAKANPKYRGIVTFNFLVLNHLFSRTISVSRDLEKALVDHYLFNPEKLDVIYNGTPPPTDVSRCNDTVRRVGTAGRLTSVKGFELFIDIAKKVSARRDDVSFTIAGDGPERQMLSDRITERGLEDFVTLEGHVDDMNDFYNRIDIYLNTSLHEGIPMTILEAMKHALPVIAPAIGGIPEIILDGEHGFLIPDRNAQRFAEKCLFLMEDRSLYEQLAKASRERVVELFSEQRMASRYLSLYNTLQNT